MKKEPDRAGSPQHSWEGGPGSPHVDDAEELPGEMAQGEGVQPKRDRPEQHLARKRNT